MNSSSDSLERIFGVDGLPESTGPYARAVSFGDLIFISGLRGVDQESGRPAEGDERRVDLIFAYLDTVLAASGSSPSYVLATRVYVTDMNALRPLVNQAYSRFFGDQLPTRTIVEVTGLNQEDSVEVEVLAARSPAAPAARGA